MFLPSVCTRSDKRINAQPYFRIRAADVIWEVAPTFHAVYEVGLFDSLDGTGINLATNAIKTASDSYGGYGPERLTDGDTTFWRCSTGVSANTSWLQFHFDAPHKVRSVTISPRSLNYPKKYALEQSADGVAWTLLKTVSTSGAHAPTLNFMSIQS